MIELWDNSALILAARDRPIAAGLREALAGDEVAISEPILLEYLNGARSVPEYARFDETLRAARLMDLIIAAVAERHGYPVAHCDRDYDRIAGLTGQRTRWVGLP
ncbi:MAG: hypothetical protein HW391_2029 [Chloroflexi bacterium]|nr:hypothetical protein [Chloroflexota bacterium]